MYCKNCGAEMDNNASVCVKCGVAAGTGSAYCTNCGAPVGAGATVCTNCGAAIVTPVATTGAGKSKMAAGLLAIFLGYLGIHNFYLGYTGKAVTQLLITLLTCGMGAAVTGIWALVEGIQILTGSIKVDAIGVPLED